MPVVEAIASGVPVITANTTSLAEVAGDGVLFDPSEPEGLLRALRLVLKCQSLSVGAGAEGVGSSGAVQWADSAQVLMRELRALVRR